MSRHARRGAALAALGSVLLTGCASVDTDIRDGGYADGTYTGKSQPDDDGSYGQVSLTIAGNDVTAVTFTLRLKDGSEKGEDYGKTNGKVVDIPTYRKAQAGIAAAPKYAAQLVETDDLSGVDAITGASLSYRQFTQAVTDALRNGPR
jgi:major membrane immunogen (membrane-anchored lipoprotein)